MDKMESKILKSIGIDPAIILIVMAVLLIAALVIAICATMNYRRLKASYAAFMRGKDGKTMEESILDLMDEFDELSDTVRKNSLTIQKILKDMLDSYQKVGILKYDAFHEMGGKLSFAITLLDGNNNGFILNSVHSREGCYNYVKEIVKGESYIELSEEETESLERAIYQETLGFDLEDK